MGKGKRRQNDAYDWQQIEQYVFLFLLRFPYLVTDRQQTARRASPSEAKMRHVRQEL